MRRDPCRFPRRNNERGSFGSRKTTNRDKTVGHDRALTMFGERTDPWNRLCKLVEIKKPDACIHVQRTYLHLDKPPAILPPSGIHNSCNSQTASFKLVFRTTIQLTLCKPSLTWISYLDFLGFLRPRLIFASKQKQEMKYRRLFYVCLKVKKFSKIFDRKAKSYDQL